MSELRIFCNRRCSVRSQQFIQPSCWSVQQGYARKRRRECTDGLIPAAMTCPDREQPAGWSVSQVSSDRRTIVDTWIECVAAHQSLHVTFSGCNKTAFLTAKTWSLHDFQGICFIKKHLLTGSIYGLYVISSKCWVWFRKVKSTRRQQCLTEISQCHIFKSSH